MLESENEYLKKHNEELSSIIKRTEAELQHIKEKQDIDLQNKNEQEIRWLKEKNSRDQQLIHDFNREIDAFNKQVDWNIKQGLMVRKIPRDQTLPQVPHLEQPIMG